MTWKNHGSRAVPVVYEWSKDYWRFEVTFVKFVHCNEVFDDFWVLDTSEFSEGLLWSKENPNVWLTFADEAVVVCGLTPGRYTLVLSIHRLYCLKHLQLRHDSHPGKNKRLLIINNSLWRPSVKLVGQILIPIPLSIHLFQMVNIYYHAFGRLLILFINLRKIFCEQTLFHLNKMFCIQILQNWSLWNFEYLFESKIRVTGDIIVGEMDANHGGVLHVVDGGRNF